MLFKPCCVTICAGNNLIASAPASSAVKASVGVIIPGIEISFLFFVSLITSVLQFGENIKLQPASDANSTSFTFNTVPAPNVSKSLQ